MPSWLPRLARALQFSWAVFLPLGVVLYAVAGTFGDVTLPFWVALLCAMGLGLGTVAAALSVRFRDVQHALPVFTQLLLYASPVAYAIVAVPEHLRRWFVLNPLTGVLDGFRWAFLGTAPPSGLSIAISVGGAVASLVAGAMIFARFERHLADVI